MIYGCLQPRELWFIDSNHVYFQTPESQSSSLTSSLLRLPQLLWSVPHSHSTLRGMEEGTCTCTCICTCIYIYNMYMYVCIQVYRYWCMYTVAAPKMFLLLYFCFIVMQFKNRSSSPFSTGFSMFPCPTKNVMEERADKF